jgi:hypothetical protein
VLDLDDRMSKIDDQILTLRAALRSADMQNPDSFSNVFHAFFDISEKSEFMDASDLVEDPVVRAMIESIARQHARDPNLAITLFQLLRHSSTGLLHGSCFATRFVGTFFYFEADQQGLVAFSDGTPTTHYYRITATVVPSGSMPMRRPPGKN